MPWCSGWHWASLEDGKRAAENLVTRALQGPCTRSSASPWASALCHPQKEWLPGWSAGASQSVHMRPAIGFLQRHAPLTSVQAPLPWLFHGTKSLKGLSSVRCYQNSDCRKGLFIPLRSGPSLFSASSSRTRGLLRSRPSVRVLAALGRRECGVQWAVLGDLTCADT